MREWLAASLAVLAASPSMAEDPGRLEHTIDQAFLYLKMNRAQHARRLLRSTVSEAPGKTDGRTWLALARAYHVEQRLDAAGRAFVRAKALGVDPVVLEESWARSLVQLFTSHVGSLELTGEATGQVKFAIALAAPMLDAPRRAVLAMLEGFDEGALTRPAGMRFFLPAGVYKIGESRVTVRAGQHQQLPIDALTPKPPGDEPK